jgi:hypothetical protein
VYFNFTEFPLFFGLCVYQFEGNVGAIQVENSMRVPHDYKKINKYGMLYVILQKSVISLVTYIAYVDTIDDIIIDDMPNHIFRGILGGIYCCVVIGTFPIQINPVADTIFRITIFDKYLRIFRDNPTIKYYLGAFLGLSFSAGIAIIIPDLHSMFNVVGGIVGTLTIAVLPVAFHNHVFKDEISWKLWLVHWIVAMFIFILGVTSSIYTIIDG